MAKITIAELDINVQALIASTSEVKKRIDDLKKQQSELTKSGETSSKAFVDNAAALRALGAEYTAGLRGITETNKAIADQTNRTQALTMAINAEVDSVDEAKAANKLLTQLRNSANASTEEGKQEILELNAALDRNNEFIRANADSLTQQRLNIGNYSTAIKDALNNINPLNGGIAGFTERSQAAGGAGNLFKDSLKGAVTGMAGLIKASLAFIATPIGAVIAAIAVVLGVLYNVFKSFQPLVEKVEQGFAALGAVIDVVRNAFVSLFTGTKSLSEAFGGLGDSMANAAQKAADLKKAEQELEDALQSQEIQSLKTRNEINKLNAQAKDITKTEEERIALLEKAEKLEKADFEARKKNTKEAVRIAQEEIANSAELTDAELADLKKRGVAYKNYVEEKGGNQDEAFKKLADALKAEQQLEGEAILNLEKNFNKQAKLQEAKNANEEKAAADAEKRAETVRENARKKTEAAISKSKTQLDIFIAQQGIRAKSLEEEVKLAEQVRDKKLKILDQELKANKLTQSEFDLQKLTTQQAFLQKQNELVISYSKAELDLFLSQNQSKLTGEQLLTQALIDEENKRLDNIRLEKLKQLELEKATNQQIIDAKINNNESLSQVDLEFLTQKNAIELEFANQNKANLKALEDQTKAEKAAQLEADNEIALGNAATKLEEDKEKNKQEFDEEIALLTAKLEKKKITQAQYDALETQAKNKRKEMDRLAELNDTQSKLNEYKKLGEGLQGLFGKNKLIASALAGINTALGVTEILKTESVLPEPFASASRAVQIATTIATGAKAVAEINGTKFEKGGIQEIGGKRHSAGGTKFYGEDGTRFEAEAGEGIGVLNRGAFAAFMNFNNRFSSGGKSSPSFMAGGGIITQGVTSSAPGLNVNDLLTAIQSMPAPVVTVEDINYQTNEVVRVVNGANF